jgi:DNA polymerase III epsilon subunit-like protein
VVASNQGHQIGVAYFVGEEKEKCLYTIKTTVDEITEEEVADSRNIASILKQFKKIVKLSVYISADSDGGIYALNVALLNEDFSCFGAEVFDFLLADDFSFPKLFNLLIDLTHQSDYLFIYRDNILDFFL